MDLKLITKNELDEFLVSTKGWVVNGNLLEKEFVFNSFANALSFLLKCGIEAEKVDHHPDMLLYGWNKVRISLSTHSLEGITKNDLILAKQIDKID